MKHAFQIEPGGRTYFLQKHPGAVAAPLGAPWYLRIQEPDGRRTWKKVGEAEQVDAAVDFARELLVQKRAGAHGYTKLKAATTERAGKRIGPLALAWETAGFPEPNGTPRGPAQAKRQAAFWRTAKPYWADIALSTVTQKTMTDYMRWRRAHVKGNHSGERAVDLELVTLSNLCKWGLAQGEVTTNPFEKRPRFRTSVTHCSEFAPENDEELHAFCGHLMAAPATAAAGAALLFSALSGLRTEELGYLKWGAGKVKGIPAPGFRYTVKTPEGFTRELMAVYRAKNGINPAIIVHPVLREFLAVWEPYCLQHYPGNPFLFPNPHAAGESLLPPALKRRTLNVACWAACAALGLPDRTPHAMRALYVRVRRSQGEDDARIAIELGQGSGPRMITKVYGDARTVFGTNWHDWRPEPPAEPCWALLTKEIKTNIVPFAVNE